MSAAFAECFYKNIVIAICLSTIGTKNEPIHFGFNIFEFKSPLKVHRISIFTKDVIKCTPNKF